MVSTLQVHITAGPQAGARFQLNQSPVTFGRSQENTLVLDLSVVSRQHGELILDETGQWLLVNLSQNGTRVGRKKVAKKPFPLSDGATINIGDTEVFRVHLIQEDQQAPAFTNTEDADQPQQPTEHAPGTGLKGRSKLWIGLGAWFAFCILFVLAIVVFRGEGDGGDDTQNNRTASGIWNPGLNVQGVPRGPQADRAEVRKLLAEPLPQQDPKPTAYANHISEANAAIETGSSGLYRAYHHYQMAISYSDDRANPLTSLDQLKYETTMDKLAQIIATEYRLAYQYVNNRENAKARKTLDNLRAKYYNNTHETDDELSGHIARLRNLAHQRAISSR